MPRDFSQLKTFLEKSEACFAGFYFDDPFANNLSSEELEKELRERFPFYNKEFSIMNQYNVFDTRRLELTAWFMQNRMKGFFERHPSPQLLLKELMRVKITNGESYFANFKGTSILYNTSACGFVIKDSIAEILFRSSYNVGNCTTLQAEYCGLLYMLIVAILMGIKKLLICGDDKIIIYHMLGYCKVPNKFLVSMYEESQLLIKNLEKVNFKLIPKYLNDEADQLAKEGLDMKTAL